MSDSENSSRAESPLFIPRSVHPKLVDSDNNTWLHYQAAAGKNEKVIDYLENESSLVDVENYLGWTPLMMACRRGHLDTVKTLLEYRANATKKNRFGMNVFQIAIASGNLELVELILEHLLCGGISKRSLESNFSPLSLAVLFQNQDILEYLMKKKFSLDLKTHITGITPLMFATAMENAPAVSQLLKNGADPSLKNYLGHTTHAISAIRQQMKDPNNIDPKVVVYQKNCSASTATNILSEMLQVRNKASPLPQVPQVPYILVSPLSNLTPTMFQFSNSPSMAFSGHAMHLRKSSNISPYFIPPPPNVTPISPLPFAPQVFFPPDFSPNQSHQIAGSVSQMFNSSDLHNARFNSSAGMFLSPSVMNFLSPCM